MINTKDLCVASCSLSEPVRFGVCPVFSAVRVAATDLNARRALEGEECILTGHGAFSGAKKAEPSKGAYERS